MTPKSLGVTKEIEKELLEAVLARGLSCACKEIHERYGIDEKSIRSYYYRKGFHRSLASSRRRGADAGSSAFRLSKASRQVVEGCLNRWDCRSLEALIREASDLTGEPACKVAVALCGMRKNGRPFCGSLALWDRVYLVYLLIQGGLSLKKIAGLLGVPANSVSSMAVVAKRFGDPAARKWGLPYSHYRVVAGLPPAEAEKWLERAAAGKWSSRRLAKAVARPAAGTAEKTEPSAAESTATPPAGCTGSEAAVAVEGLTSTGPAVHAGQPVAAELPAPAQPPSTPSRGESMSRLELVIRREYLRKGGRKLKGAELEAIAAETGTPYWRVCGKYGSMVSQGRLPLSTATTWGSCGCLWEKGDALLQYLDAGFGFGEAASALGLPLSQAYQLADVCRKFPPEKRVYSLPVSFHAAAALGEDPDALLRRAVEEGWGLEDLERAAAGMMTYRELAVRYMAAFKKAVERGAYQVGRSRRKAAGAGQDAGQPVAAAGSADSSRPAPEKQESVSQKGRPAEESTETDSGALARLVEKLVEEKLAVLLKKE